MRGRRRLIHAIFLFVLPIIVAAFGLSIATAVMLVSLALIWRWALSVSAIMVADRGPNIILDTISMSHFAEKARWCLDRLGVDYVENASAGVVGVVFTGRTVPRLRFHSGIVESSIGNSPQILRYLWGEYGVALGERAAFLEPSPARLELEQRIDRYGVDLQVWTYYHLLPNRDLCLRVWGGDSPQVPWWQRMLLRPMFPLLAFFIRRTFSINDEHYAKAVQHIEDMLGDIDTRLADGRRSVLGGDDTDYVDIALAAVSGLWRQPHGYGGGRADACRIERNHLPAPMRADIERWTEDYPKVASFIARLYEEERMQGTKTPAASPTPEREEAHAGGQH